MEIPVEVELVKPFYNDVIGFLFFSNEPLLYKIFSKPNISFSDEVLRVDGFRIKDVALFDFLVQIIERRLEVISEITSDFSHFSRDLFRRLLLLCHLLTKDPNTYTHEKFALFVVVAFALLESDPVDLSTLKGVLMRWGV